MSCGCKASEHWATVCFSSTSPRLEVTRQRLKIFGLYDDISTASAFMTAVAEEWRVSPSHMSWRCGDCVHCRGWRAVGPDSCLMVRQPSAYRTSWLCLLASANSLSIASGGTGRQPPGSGVTVASQFADTFARMSITGSPNPTTTGTSRNVGLPSTTISILRCKE